MFNSSDPALNAAMFVMAVIGAVILFVAGAFVLVPVAAGFGLFKAAQWYAHRPTASTELLSAAQRIAAPSNEAFLERHLPELLQSVGPVADTVFAEMAVVADALYTQEDLATSLALAPPPGTIEEGRYRDQLIARSRKTADLSRTLHLFTATLTDSLAAFAKDLPPLARTSTSGDERAAITIPLIDLLANAGETVQRLLAPYFSERACELGLFTPLRRQLEANLAVASAKSKTALLPSDHAGSAREIVSLYLANTPLLGLFAASVPFTIAMPQRMEHCALYSGSGGGKTQTLQHLIAQDLEAPDPPALVIIDSQNQMLRKIERLEMFATRLRDRLVIIDPEDNPAPALNMFQLPAARLAKYSAADREMMEGQIVDLFNYIFAATAQELTAKQGTAFSYIVRAMLAHPGATIETLLRMMEGEAQDFADTIHKLDPLTQAYFANQFYQKANNPTRQQVARRLYGLLRIPAFRRMFSAPTNKLDIFDVLQSGKIVLVNTAAKTLGDASPVFGRFIVALTLAAAIERTEVHGSQRPAILYLDEASEYFDEKTERILIQARKSNLGLCYATQFLSQMPHSLRQAAAANTTIKFANGSTSFHDARELAADMRTSAEFIMGLGKVDRSHANWACYVRNVTGTAVQLAIPFGTLESRPRMSDDQYSVIRERNRTRYCEPYQDKPAHGSTTFPGEPTSFADEY